MSSINSVVIVGNLTRDPELKTLPSGAQVCELGVAVNERIKRGDQWEDYANFFDVSVFGGQATSCANYLSKGRQVAVKGRLRQSRWEKDGAKRSKVAIVAEDVQFIGPRDQQQQAAGGVPFSAEGLAPAAPAAGGFADDDIPF